MTEIVCQLCNVQTPENAFYCQQCGQPLRCKNCHAHLLPNARACIQCGQLIPERTANEEAHMGMISIPIGYNRLKLHETPDLCDLDLTVSNEAIANLGDLLPSLMGTRPRRHNGNLVNNQPQKQSDSVEVAPETVPSQPQLPPASSKTDSPNAIPSDLIWEIFRKQEGGGLKQDIINLKASGKKDYTMRLVYLYLYARFNLTKI